MISAVRFAAMMPARRATCNGSPFFTARERIARAAAAFIRTSPSATASRTVSGLAPTSTMRARPCSSTCDSRAAPRRRLGGLFIAVSPREEEGQALERHREIHVLQLHARRHLERAGREVEDRTNAGLHGGIDDALSGLGRHGHDRDVDV